MMSRPPRQMNERHPGVDRERRRFLASALLTFGAARVGLAAAPAKAAPQAASPRIPRELAAVGRAAEWLNSPRLTVDGLLGKVVAVSFCTYTCINWLRTVPYLRAWAHAYRQGLVVIGVHTPEFAFEHDVDNVRRVMQQMGIEYPIVIDNDYAIWRAFDNQYWPALYLLDGRGRVRHRQFGEGGYQAATQVLQRLLRDAGAATGADGGVPPDGSGFEAAADWANLKSPETYVGYDRAENFASLDAARRDQPRAYRAPSRLALNQWSLVGDWTIGGQPAVLNKGPGHIVYRFHARDVHLVMGASRSGRPVPFRVAIDGQPPGAAHGLDTDEGGNGWLREPRLYQLLRQRTAIADRTFTIEFLEAGAEAFSFTFG